MSAYIVSAGARTAIGLDVVTTGFLLRAGMPAFSEAPLADSSGEPITMAWVPTIDPRTTGAERLAALIRGPLEEVSTPLAGARCQVRISIDEGSAAGSVAASITHATAARVFPAASIQVEASGESALGTWLPEALAAVAARSCDAVVLGGVHTDYDQPSIRGLEARGRLFSRDNLDGRVPGEAAAVVVVMNESEARRRGLEPRARVLGFGTGRELARPDNDHPSYEAAGMTEAVRRATEVLSRAGETTGWMITDLTQEIRRMREWEAVFIRMSHVLDQPYAVDSPAQRIGYLGAAALPLFVALTATSWAHGYAPADTALAMAGNDDGDRAALVLGRA